MEVNANKRDRQHLKLLAIAHYVVASLTGLIACVPLIHLRVGISLLSGEFAYNTPPLFGLFFTFMAAMSILLGWALAVALFLVGHFLARHQHRIICLIVAGASCLYTPIGTLLGIFTILVLMRPSVIALFAATAEDDLRPASENKP